ncbi:MAG: tol-pal system protein YbgF [Acidobacteria bacterium]|nr:MAG: tol-pal system protein YbgF [Acidobacteriota bacterium]PYR82448.1 MAG: tol-pal system protein YbgF [Acidobacteriota bacterium]
MMKRILTIVAVLLAAAAPASAQSREQRQMMADIRMLQQQTQELQVAIGTLTQALQDQITQIKTVNTRIDAASDAQRKGFADQKVTIDEMGKDLRAIRERVDDTNVRVSNVREEIEALRNSIPVAAPISAAPPVPVGDPNAPAAPAPTTGPTPPPSTAGLSPTRMFDTARADYAAGQWSLAITGFDAFLKTFPRSEMADDAQFLIGETYYAQNKWMDAIAAYNAVIQNYPMGNAVPEAYYKRGLAQERLGQLDDARESWNTVIQMAPDSDAGRLAKQNLDRVARRPAQ